MAKKKVPARKDQPGVSKAGPPANESIAKVAPEKLEALEQECVKALTKYNAGSTKQAHKALVALLPSTPVSSQYLIYRYKARLLQHDAVCCDNAQIEERLKLFKEAHDTALLAVNRRNSSLSSALLAACCLLQMLLEQYFIGQANPRKAIDDKKVEEVVAWLERAIQCCVTCAVEALKQPLEEPVITVVNKAKDKTTYDPELWVRYQSEEGTKLLEKLPNKAELPQLRSNCWKEFRELLTRLLTCFKSNFANKVDNPFEEAKRILENWSSTEVKQGIQRLVSNSRWHFQPDKDIMSQLQLLRLQHAKAQLTCLEGLEALGGLPQEWSDQEYDVNRSWMYLSEPDGDSKLKSEVEKGVMSLVVPRQGRTDVKEGGMSRKKSRGAPAGSDKQDAQFQTVLPFWDSLSQQEREQLLNVSLLDILNDACAQGTAVQCIKGLMLLVVDEGREVEYVASERGDESYTVHHCSVCDEVLLSLDDFRDHIIAFHQEFATSDTEEGTEDSACVKCGSCRQAVVGRYYKLKPSEEGGCDANSSSSAASQRVPAILCTMCCFDIHKGLRPDAYMLHTPQRLLQAWHELRNVRHQKMMEEQRQKEQRAALQDVVEQHIIPRKEEQLAVLEQLQKSGPGGRSGRASPGWDELGAAKWPALAGMVSLESIVAQEQTTRLVVTEHSDEDAARTPHEADAGDKFGGWMQRHERECEELDTTSAPPSLPWSRSPEAPPVGYQFTSESPRDPRLALGGALSLPRPTSANSLGINDFHDPPGMPASSCASSIANDSIDSANAFPMLEASSLSPLSSLHLDHDSSDPLSALQREMEEVDELLVHLRSASNGRGPSVGAGENGERVLQPCGVNGDVAHSLRVASRASNVSMSEAFVPGTPDAEDRYVADLQQSSSSATEVSSSRQIMQLLEQHGKGASNLLVLDSSDKKLMHDLQRISTADAGLQELIHHITMRSNQNGDGTADDAEAMDVQQTGEDGDDQWTIDGVPLVDFHPPLTRAVVYAAAQHVCKEHPEAAAMLSDECLEHIGLGCSQPNCAEHKDLKQQWRSIKLGEYKLRAQKWWLDHLTGPAVQQDGNADGVVQWLYDMRVLSSAAYYQQLRDAWANGKPAAEAMVELLEELAQHKRETRLLEKWGRDVLEQRDKMSLKFHVDMLGWSMGDFQDKWRILRGAAEGRGDVDSRPDPLLTDIWVTATKAVRWVDRHVAACEARVACKELCLQYEHRVYRRDEVAAKHHAEQLEAEVRQMKEKLQQQKREHQQAVKNSKNKKLAQEMMTDQQNELENDVQSKQKLFDCCRDRVGLVGEKISNVRKETQQMERLKEIIKSKRSSVIRDMDALHQDEGEMLRDAEGLLDVMKRNLELLAELEQGSHICMPIHMAVNDCATKIERNIKERMDKRRRNMSLILERMDNVCACNLIESAVTTPAVRLARAKLEAAALTAQEERMRQLLEEEEENLSKQKKAVEPPPNAAKKGKKGRGKGGSKAAAVPRKASTASDGEGELEDGRKDHEPSDQDKQRSTGAFSEEAFLTALQKQQQWDLGTEARCDSSDWPEEPPSTSGRDESSEAEAELQRKEEEDMARALELSAQTFQEEQNLLWRPRSYTIPPESTAPSALPTGHAAEPAQDVATQATVLASDEEQGASNGDIGTDGNSKRRWLKPLASLAPLKPPSPGPPAEPTAGPGAVDKLVGLSVEALMPRERKEPLLSLAANGVETDRGPSRSGDKWLPLPNDDSPTASAARPDGEFAANPLNDAWVPKAGPAAPRPAANTHEAVASHESWAADVSITGTASELGLSDKKARNKSRKGSKEERVEKPEVNRLAGGASVDTLDAEAKEPAAVSNRPGTEAAGRAGRAADSRVLDDQRGVNQPEWLREADRGGSTREERRDDRRAPRGRGGGRKDRERDKDREQDRDWGTRERERGARDWDGPNGSRNGGDWRDNRSSHRDRRPALERDSWRRRGQGSGSRPAQDARADPSNVPPIGRPASYECSHPWSRQHLAGTDRVDDILKEGLLILDWSGKWQCPCGEINLPVARARYCSGCRAAAPCRDYILGVCCFLGTCQFPHPYWAMKDHTRPPVAAVFPQIGDPWLEDEAPRSEAKAGKVAHAAEPPAVVPKAAPAAPVNAWGKTKSTEGATAASVLFKKQGTAPAMTQSSHGSEWTPERSRPNSAAQHHPPPLPPGASLSREVPSQQQDGTSPVPARVFVEQQHHMPAAPADHLPAGYHMLLPRQTFSPHPQPDRPSPHLGMPHQHLLPPQQPPQPALAMESSWSSIAASQPMHHQASLPGINGMPNFPQPLHHPGDVMLLLAEDSELIPHAMPHQSRVPAPVAHEEEEDDVTDSLLSMLMTGGQGSVSTTREPQYQQPAHPFVPMPQPMAELLQPPQLPQPPRGPPPGFPAQPLASHSQPRPQALPMDEPDYQYLLHHRSAPETSRPVSDPPHASPARPSQQPASRSEPAPAVMSFATILKNKAAPKQPPPQADDDFQAMLSSLTHTDVQEAAPSVPPSTSRMDGTYSQAGPGLVNEVGTYNCFLNVIIQCLWNLSCFRDHILAMNHTSGLHSSEAKVLVALQNVFRNLAASQKVLVHSGADPTRNMPAAVDPTELREALSQVNKSLFRSGEMGDAQEALESIFDYLDRAMDELADPFAARHKLAQAQPLNAFKRLFGLPCREWMHCAQCGMKSRLLHYTKFTQLLPVDLARMAPKESGMVLEHLLRRLMANQHDLRPCDKDEGGCGTMQSTKVTLTNAPQVFSLALIWDTASASEKDIASVCACLTRQLDLREAYPELMTQHLARDVSATYHLRAMVCYYGSHYNVFVCSHETGTWQLADDTTVRHVGSWADVARQCRLGRLQPLVVMYEADAV